MLTLLHNKLKSLSLITTLFIFAACQPGSRVVETKESVLAFGTFVEITLINVSDKERELVLKKIGEDLEYFHYALHPWKAGPTGRVNQLLAVAGEFTANPSLLPIIRQSQRYSAQSQGLFNPAIGNLMQVWGYHEDLPSEGPPPAPADVQTWLDKKPSMANLTIKGVRLQNTNPAVKLDFGAIGKGYALDVVLQHIQEMGVTDAIINTGGDLKVLGSHGDRPWKIAIRHPRKQGIIASLEAKDGEAIFTSGDYERFYEFEGKRYHHIIDPRTGYPADQTQSVTVIHANGALADAAATALFVAGPSQWLPIAKAMGIEQAMLIDKTGRVLITPAMHQRIKFELPDLNIEIVDFP